MKEVKSPSGPTDGIDLNYNQGERKSKCRRVRHTFQLLTVALHAKGT